MVAPVLSRHMIQGTAYDFNSSCPRFSVRNVKIVGIGHSELVLVYDGPPQADFAGVKTAAADLRKWLLRQEPWINFSTQRFCKVFQTKSLRVFVQSYRKGRHNSEGSS
jgi:hypothetical protein